MIYRAAKGFFLDGKEIPTGGILENLTTEKEKYLLKCGLIVEVVSPDANITAPDANITTPLQAQAVNTRIESNNKNKRNPKKEMKNESNIG